MKNAVFVVSGAAIACTSCASAALLNGGFEQPDISLALPAPDNVFRQGIKSYHQSDVNDWFTSSPDGIIEIWDNTNTGPKPNQGTVFADTGNQFAEINANNSATLFTFFTPNDPGAGLFNELTLFFAHRGRAGTDTMNVTVTDLGADGVAGGGNDTVLSDADYTSGADDWSNYAVNLGNASGNVLLIEFSDVDTASNSNSIGNFLDSVSFGQVTVPTPGTAALAGLAVALGMTRRRTGNA